MFIKLSIDDTILTVLNHFLVLSMALYIFCKDLFHDHSREIGEADKPGVPRVLLSIFKKKKI